MTAWLSIVYWKLRGRRSVRIQYVNNGGAVDGILLGTIAGHYRLRNAYFYEHRPDAQGVELVGETWIPKDKVFLVQVKLI